MKKGLLIMLTMCILAGCKKDNQQQIVDGTYEGEFMITLGAEKTVSKYQLTIADGQYQSTKGSGTYTISGNQVVNFKDMNIWPAIIDASTILAGDYSYQTDGGSLTLVKKFKPVEQPELSLMLAIKYEYRLLRVK